LIRSLPSIFRSSIPCRTRLLPFTAKCCGGSRYRLEQLLPTFTRHFLLLTATLHNGKEADFQLFLALLDGDYLECKFRWRHYPLSEVIHCSGNKPS
jgi:hypothetical protein